ncbi:MAG: putative DNA binding domain-containing protein [Oscillospiraceae bacterium]|nr:putative DNA binding domain-containing protein [Oscillospiraceae bacterium]
MAESQNIEYKESWRDEYLKWICGFANAQGGTIYIGIDDAGTVVGVKDVKKLMEDIPNKIQSGLGIIADVNKHTKDGKDYLEIKVDPSSFPISYHGEFHYRSGATKQQLTGIALTEFITKKTGVRWEDVTVDGITVEDLDAESFKIFRREALRSKRMTEAELNISNEELLSKLKLLSNGKLKRSAVLLFYGDPSIVQNGSYVKVGKFEHGTVAYHDDLEGSLISTADKVVDLIYLKYLKAKITYEHDRRVETYPFARNAIREAIYNAIAHNCYMYGTPIQIRIEEEQIIVSNHCILPEGWTTETLMQPHDSIPYNPDIANVFYRAGYIETWGQGIQKICDECIALGAELPRYEILGTGIRVYFPALRSALMDQSNTPKGHSAKNDGTLDDTMAYKIIEVIRCKPDITLDQLSTETGIARRTLVRYMSALKEAGRIERVGGKRYGHWEIRDDMK